MWFLVQIKPLLFLILVIEPYRASFGLSFDGHAQRSVRTRHSSYCPARYATSYWNATDLIHSTFADQRLVLFSVERKPGLASITLGPLWFIGKSRVYRLAPFALLASYNSLGVASGISHRQSVYSKRDGTGSLAWSNPYFDTRDRIQFSVPANDCFNVISTHIRLVLGISQLFWNISSKWEADRQAELTRIWGGDDERREFTTTSHGPRSLTSTSLVGSCFGVHIFHPVLSTSIMDDYRWVLSNSHSFGSIVNICLMRVKKIKASSLSHWERENNNNNNNIKQTHTK